MSYTVDPNNASAPLDTDDASYMAAELRALKSKLATLVIGEIFTASGTADVMLGTLPTLTAYLRVTCVPVGANTVVAPTLNGIVIVKYNAAGVLIPLVAGDYSAVTAFTFVYLPLGYLGVDCWVLNLSAASVSANTNVGAVRHSVLTGKRDISGVPAALVAGGGLTVDLSASTTDKLVITAAQSYGSVGPVDVVESFYSNVAAIVTAPSDVYSYVYRDIASAWGVTKARPQYGKSYNPNQQEHLALNNNAYSDFGNTWTLGAGVSYDNTDSVIAGTYMADFDGTANKSITRTFGSYISLNNEGWTLRFKFRCGQVGVLKPILSLLNAAGFGISLTQQVSNVLKLELSSNGTTWNITAVNSVGSIALNQKYDLEIRFDGDTYSLFVDGSVQGPSTASTAKICPVNKIFLMENLTLFNIGRIQDFEYLPYVVHPSVNFFTPSTTLADITVANYCSDWFDIIKMQMYKLTSISSTPGVNPGFTAVSRVYVGEILADIALLTDLTTYAYGGNYDSELLGTLPGASGDVTHSHNLGVKTTKAPEFYFECTAPIAGYIPGERFTNLDIITTWDVNTAGFSIAAAALTLIPKTGGAAVAIGATNTSYGMRHTRGW